MIPLLFSALSLTASADEYATSKGIALAGLGLGVGGNLVTIGAQVTLIDDVDDTTDPPSIDPAAIRAIDPVVVSGGTVRRLGGALMGYGTLRMHAANRKAGAEYTNTPGKLAVAFGLASTAFYLPARILNPAGAETVASERALAGLALGVGSYGLIGASFSFGFVQYVMNQTNKPAKRRKIEEVRHFRMDLVPSHNGLVVVGTF